jgi:hypothetical protein
MMVGDELVTNLDNEVVETLFASEKSGGKQ